MNKTRAEKMVDIFVVYLPLVLLTLVVVYPFYYLLINSFNETLVNKPEYLIVKNFTFQSYKSIFNDRSLLHAMFVSAARTVVGAVTTVFICAMAAFSLRKKNLLFRAFILVILTIPMFFRGGLIPRYLNLRMLGLLDTFLVYIIPRWYKFFYLIIMMSVFGDVADEMEEAAIIDGAGYFSIFIKIYIPVCIPVIATMLLFESVDAWNEWFDTVYFTRSRDLLTLQAVLVRVIRNADYSNYQQALQSAMDRYSNNPEGIKLATMFVAVVPILMVYPFLQRYFIKGIMIGSLKG